MEQRCGGGSAAAAAALLETYYIPWRSKTAGEPKAQPDSASALRLAVRFDQTAAKAGDEIVCRVEAQRTGFRWRGGTGRPSIQYRPWPAGGPDAKNYGMMLAEIGLPPGAEVEGAS